MQLCNLLAFANLDPSNDFVNHCENIFAQVSGLESMLAYSDWVNETTVEVKHFINLFYLALVLHAFLDNIVSLFRRRCFKMI